MAKNDIVLIDSIINGLNGSAPMTGQRKGELFEQFATEQLLKEYDLSAEELTKGIVDGKDDGGIDSMFIFVNGILLQDSQDFTWPRSSCEITVVAITCKHYETFKQDVVNSEIATISEIFDLSVSDSNLIGHYNNDILYQRQLFNEAYVKTAAHLTNLHFRFYFASRGDTTEVGENIRARSEQIKAKMKELFSNCKVDYDYIGCSELFALYQKKRQYNLSLPYVSQIEQKGGHVVLAKLTDYYHFIIDEEGRLRKYLFDSNVRDYMGLNPVNEDILGSLRDKKKTDFWWLNNGITILATAAVSANGMLTVSNVQIVNGLQTSQTIFQYYSTGGSLDDERLVMIKIVKQDDADIRDAIIRSTNNQTSIAVTSLFATDLHQRRIEEVMKTHGLYYERRVNYYVNQGIDRELIFDIMYLAAGYIGLVMRAPEFAARLKMRHLKDSTKYDTIFNQRDSLLIWPKVARILRSIDVEVLKLLDKAPDFTYSSNRLKRLRYVIGVIICARLVGKFNYTIDDLINLDTNMITKELIDETWTFSRENYANEFMTKRWYLNVLFSKAATKWGVTSGLDIAMRKTTIFNDRPQKPATKNKRWAAWVDAVKQEVPPLPWHQAVAKTIGLKLSLSSNVVARIIQYLTEKGEI